MFSYFIKIDKRNHFGKQYNKLNVAKGVYMILCLIKPKLNHQLGPDKGSRIVHFCSDYLF